MEALGKFWFQDDPACEAKGPIRVHHVHQGPDLAVSSGHGPFLLARGMGPSFALGMGAFCWFGAWALAFGGRDIARFCFGTWIRLLAWDMGPFFWFGTWTLRVVNELCIFCCCVASRFRAGCGFIRVPQTLPKSVTRQRVRVRKLACTCVAQQPSGVFHLSWHPAGFGIWQDSGLCFHRLHGGHLEDAGEDAWCKAPASLTGQDIGIVTLWAFCRGLRGGTWSCAGQQSVQPEGTQKISIMTSARLSLPKQPPNASFCSR